MIRYLQFTAERLLLRGVHYRLLVAALIVLTVSVLAGLAVRLLDPGFDELGGAIWWAFLRLTDPGYLGDDEGAVSRTVSTVVTILGYLLFLGLLIAILTQWMNQWIQRIESGVSALQFRDHIVILGWNHRTPSIVLELLQSTDRARRFLEDRGASEIRIVVLAREVDGDLRRTLKVALDELWDDRKVILRAGNPLQIDSLERVAFSSAGAVILPGADFAIAQPGVSDAETIKTLASISHHEADPERLPLAVAALYNSNREVIARSAYAGALAVVDADRTVARLMAQSVLQPGVWDVYAVLLSVAKGHALFVRENPAGQSATFGELRPGSGRSLLIGFIESDSRTVHVNPSDTHTVSEGDELVFIAERYEDCKVRPEALSKAMPEALPEAQSNGVRLQAPDTSARRILVLGWSRKVPLLVDELLNYENRIGAIDVVGITPVEERSAGRANDRVRQLAANFLDADALEALRPSDYDNVVLIARQRLGDEAVADAATLSAYLSLERLLPESGTHRFVEVLEEENEALFNERRDDVMLSPLVVSYVLSQVALKPELGLVFGDLAQPAGSCISLLSLVPSPGSPIRYGDLCRAARTQRCLAIGVLADAVNGGRVLLNPDDDLCWTPDENDRVIVLTPADD